MTDQAFGSGDIERLMARVAGYLEATGHICVAWMWLKQLLAVRDAEGNFYYGKPQAGGPFAVDESEGA